MAKKSRQVMRKQIDRIGKLYFNRGLKIWEISEQMGLAQTTVYENIEKYRKWMADAIGLDPVKEHLYENLSNKKEIIQRAWNGYSNATTQKDQRAWLYMVNNVYKDILELLERLKVVEKVAESVNIIHSYEEDKKRSREWLDTLYVKKIKKKQ